MKKNILISLFISIIVAVSIFLFWQLYQSHSNSNNPPTRFEGGDNQFVFEKHTIESVGGPNNYAFNAKNDYYLTKASDLDQQLFYEFSGLAYNNSATFDGEYLIIDQTDSADSSKTRRKYIDIDGEEIKVEIVDTALPNIEISSSDGRYTARTVYKRNAEPVVDGEPIVSFVNTIVEETVSKKVITTYTSDEFSSYGAVIPKLFSADGKSIILVDRYEFPQEIGSPEAWYIQEIGGSKRKLFNNPVIDAQGREFAFVVLKVYPSLNMMAGFKRYIFEDNYASNDILVIYDFSTEQFIDTGIAIPYGQLFPEEGSTIIYYLTLNNEIGKYDVSTGRYEKLTTPITIASIFNILDFSSDGTLMAFTTSSQETRNSSEAQQPNVNGTINDVNVTKTYLYDILHNSLKLILTSEQPIYREYVGNSYYTFLGFVN